MVADALRLYFQPLKYLYVLFHKSISLEDERKALQLRLDDVATVLKVIQKAVCFNQGAYLQYSFITAEKHKKLKKAFHKDADAQHISMLAKDLMDFINEDFYNNTFENFKFLRAYFKNRKGPDPRICIKGSFTVDNKTTVISVFRDDTVDYDSDTQIEKNYGFYKIYNTGTYYLENNIPLASARDRYFNPRLDNECAKKLLSSRQKFTKKEWKDCWIEKSNKPSAYYQSTLIVPITLWNNSVSEEFKKLINMENVDRTIFGFLCFDHEEVNYFKKEEDVAVGYVIADILSLYVFTRLVYMEISKTFNSVEQWLDSKKVDIKPESLATLWKSVPIDLDVDKILAFKPKKTKQNDLFSVDHDLLKFIGTISANNQVNKDASR